MCQFKSAIVLKDESVKGGFRLLMSPWTESHSELCTIFKLKDGARLNFARVEFSPPSMDTAYLPETYKLKIDEERTPEWFSDEIKENVAAKMRDYIKSIIVAGDVELLVGGQFIIAPTAKIECAHSMVISAMCGGTLTAMWGGTLTAMCGGTLTEMRGGTLTEMRGGTLTTMRGGTLTKMRGGTLTEMRGGTLTTMRGGTLTAMCGGTLTAMWGGTLTEMRGGTVLRIDEYFSGLFGKVGGEAIIVKDERLKPIKKEAAK
jgi:hypothetical protein